MALSVYKPGQGKYARIGAAVALLLMSLLASYSLWRITSDEKPLAAMGMSIPMNAWGAALMVLLAALTGVLTGGVTLGVRGLDRMTHSFVDLLIDMQAELQKVAWPSRAQVTTSTIYVLVTIILLGGFLLLVDYGLTKFMRWIAVLPKAGGA